MRVLSGDYAAQRKLFMEADHENVIRLEDQIRESAEKVAHGAHGMVQICLPPWPSFNPGSPAIAQSTITASYRTIDVDVDPMLPPHAKKFIAENIIREQLGV